jgi:hypothetical protein
MNQPIPDTDHERPWNAWEALASFRRNPASSFADHLDQARQAELKESFSVEIRPALLRRERDGFPGGVEHVPQPNSLVMPRHE